MKLRTRVLAVDDDPANLAIIEEALQGQFDLRTAGSGPEALRIAADFRPDVVLLDVMMPTPNGLAVCRRLKNHESFEHSRVLLVSAKTSLTDRLRGYDAGADDYVTKPFDEDELLAKVAAAANTAASIQQARGASDSVCGAAGHALEEVMRLGNADFAVHLERVSAYVRVLAGQLAVGCWSTRVDDCFIEDCVRAAKLYDVGMLKIPESVRLKQSPLDMQERFLIQQHTIAGEEILKRIALRHSEMSYFYVAAQMARWHHERYDGGGYPDGLAGEAIPLPARLVKVADVYDALTSARPYKRVCEPLEAKRVIESGKGEQFDPEVVEAMLQAFDEFVAVGQGGDESSCREMMSATV